MRRRHSINGAQDSTIGASVVAALVVASVAVVLGAVASGCSATTDNAGPAAPTSTTASTTPLSAPTLAPAGPTGAAMIDDNTGEIAGATDLPMTNPALTAVPDLPTSTIPQGTTTTMPHGAGVTLETNDGDPIKPEVSTTAKEIYQAAVSRDYGKIQTIIGDRRFRWGFIGQRGPAAQWAKDFSDGKDDQVKRIIRLLETKPLVDQRGNTVWPYLALKDPIDWSDEDDALAASLGFQPENIAETKLKGKYLDYRLVIDPTGIWTGFYVGN